MYRIFATFKIAFWGILLCALLSGRALAEPAAPDLKSELNGKTIRSITIRIDDIFEAPSNMFYKGVNSLKINTRPHVVRQELLFREGDTYDEFRVRESERSLRSLKYMRNAEIVAHPDGDYVDILVVSQDTWSIIPQLGYSSGDGRDRLLVGLAESNFAGHGKRLEVLYEEDDSEESVSGVYYSRRVLESDQQLLAGYFDRNDGERYKLNFGRPFRTFFDTYSWDTDADISDTIGRLYEAGDERFIFRQDINDVNFRFTLARGNPEVRRLRYSAGYRYLDKDFTQATLQDFDDIGLEPEDVESNDPALVPEDRRFSGPVLGFESIEPDFVSMNYVDRFSRIADYNLGWTYSSSFLFAPEALGSLEDALILSGNIGAGSRFSKDSFLRGEMSLSSRLVDDGFENSVLRGEFKYYNVLGPKHLLGMYLGKHTFASHTFFDFGHDLDRDREFLIGGDNAIRGYKARTFTGDKRFALNIEDRMHFAENVWDLISIGGATFIDVGGATTQSVGRLFTDDLYSNVGAGLRFAFPRSSGERVLRMDISLPLRDGIDGSDTFEPRFIVSGGQLFGARTRTEVLGPEKASLDIGFD